MQCIGESFLLLLLICDFTTLSSAFENTAESDNIVMPCISHALFQLS